LIFYKEAGLKETSIGEIPRDWDVVRLGDVSETVKGKKPTRLLNEKSENSIPYLTAEYMRANSNVQWCERDDPNAIQVNKNDLLMIWDGSYSGDVFIGFGGALASTMIRITPAETLDRHFFHYFLTTKFDFLKGTTSGTGVPHVSKGIFENLLVPYPPLNEQRAIVGVLGVVDLAVAKTGEVISKTERLKKGLMQTLLTQGIGHKEYKQTPIGTIPKEWEVTTIDEECLVGTGGTPSRSHPQFFGGNIPWVKSTEVNYNIITKTEEALTESGIQNSNAKMYPKGSLIVALYGQGITRGKCAILGIDAAINQACAAVRSKGRIYIPYLFCWFQNSYTDIRRLSQGANQANLNMEIIRSLRIPLPSIHEQQKISEILSNLDEKLELERNEKAILERIKLGLMDLLLTGKIRVKVD
jgi:type I restriction enzyme S subunit